MRIALLASGSVGSSLTARLVNLGRELAQSGHDVVLVAPSCDKYTGFRREPVQSLYGMKVVQPRQFSSRHDTWNFLPYLPSAMWQVLKQRADIIHLYKPTPLTLVGLVGRLDRRTKVVLDMDDLGDLVMQREGAAAWRVALVRMSQRLAANAADAIVVASTYLEVKYAAAYPLKPILKVPNGVTGTRNHPRPTATRSIVFIGSLNSEVVLAPLLEAVPAISAATVGRPLRVMVVGDGTEMKSLRGRVRSLGLDDVVSFTGWIPTTELTATVEPGGLGYCCVPDTDAFRAASNQKVFEYLSLGLVPVVNRVGDLPGYIDDGRCGYIVEGSLTETLVQALRETDERLSKVEAGARFLEANFLWPGLAARVERLYKSLCKR